MTAQAYLARSLKHSGKMGLPLDPRIARAAAEMQRRLAEPLDLETLAEQVKLTAPRFSRLFERQVGVAPAVYQRRLRLHRARVLIERTFLSIEQTMRQVGYTQMERFLADFEELHGVPAAWLRAKPKEPSASGER